MKNIITILFLISAIYGAGASYLYLTGKIAFIGIFFCGLLSGILIMNFVLNIKNSKINSYKRELEKESIASTESSSRVKVLESKIEVLEKALENALRGKE